MPNASCVSLVPLGFGSHLLAGDSNEVPARHCENMFVRDSRQYGKLGYVLIRNEKGRDATAIPCGGLERRVALRRQHGISRGLNQLLFFFKHDTSQRDEHYAEHNSR